MQIARSSLGVIHRHGADVIAPVLVTFGDVEADFLARHVAKVRTAGVGGRSLSIGSGDSAWDASGATPRTPGHWIGSRHPYL